VIFAGEIFRREESSSKSDRRSSSSSSSCSRRDRRCSSSSDSCKFDKDWCSSSSSSNSTCRSSSSSSNSCRKACPPIFTPICAPICPPVCPKPKFKRSKKCGNVQRIVASIIRKTKHCVKRVIKKRTIELEKEVFEIVNGTGHQILKETKKILDEVIRDVIEHCPLTNANVNVTFLSTIELVNGSVMSELGHLVDTVVGKISNTIKSFISKSTDEGTLNTPMSGIRFKEFINQTNGHLKEFMDMSEKVFDKAIGNLKSQLGKESSNEESRRNEKMKCKEIIALLEKAKRKLLTTIERLLNLEKEGIFVVFNKYSKHVIPEVERIIKLAGKQIAIVIKKAIDRKCCIVFKQKRLCKKEERRPTRKCHKKSAW